MLHDTPKMIDFVHCVCTFCLAAAVGTDGVVRFVDVVEGKVCCCIEPATQKQACVKMALDRRGNYAALITQEGEVGGKWALPVSCACNHCCGLLGQHPVQSVQHVQASCLTSGTAIG